MTAPRYATETTAIARSLGLDGCPSFISRAAWAALLADLDPVKQLARLVEIVGYALDEDDETEPLAEVDVVSATMDGKAAIAIVLPDEAGDELTVGRVARIYRGRLQKHFALPRTAKLHRAGDGVRP